MNGLQFDVTCPSCGADTNLVNSGRVIAGRETTAVVGCSECRREFSVHLDIRPTRLLSGAFMRGMDELEKVGA